MSTAYAPTCPACRTNDGTTFHHSCVGCQARKTFIEIQRQAADQVTPARVDAMDSTMQPLEATR